MFIDAHARAFQERANARAVAEQAAPPFEEELDVCDRLVQYLTPLRLVDEKPAAADARCRAIDAASIFAC